MMPAAAEAASLLLLLIFATSVNSYSPSISVFDGVLTSTAANTLHDAAKSVGLGHKVFARPLRPDGTYGLIERALDGMLTEMESLQSDNIKHQENVSDQQKPHYVEYWARQEWRSIEAHADVDEFHAKEEDAANTYTPGPDGYRYPKYGHVLYLKVGSNVRGPTCVFPNKRSGGELLRDVGNISKDDTNEAYCDADKSKVELFVVPAREGRVLRFPGSALHAVPRPENLWFLPFVMGSATHEPEEEWGRSVVLFNLWEGEPPKGVSLNEGGGHREEMGDATLDDDMLCRKGRDWTKVEILNVDDHAAETKPAKVWLLGNERRRDHAMRTVKLSASTAIEGAMAEKKFVYRAWMKNEL